MDDNRRPDADHLAKLALQQARTHALILLDSNGLVADWMGGAELIFGYTREEMVGENFRVLFTPEDQDKGLDRLELEIAQQSGEAEDDRWQVRKDGGRFWASGAVTPLKDAAGSLTGYLKILRNRSDSKIHIETLEKRLDALETTNRRKDNTLAAFAHDLRTPLSSLANAAHILEMEDVSEDLKTVVGLIRRQVEFMVHMVEDVMDATSITAGKVTLKKRVEVLQELIEAACEACQPAVDQRRHQLQLLMPTTPVNVMADRTRLCQVFINLIDNAVKYTPEGGQIWIKATIDGEDAVVKVVDTGIGIEADMFDRIFELFSQAHAEGTSAGGLGIGLSVVKDIVTMHQGIVQVISDGPGKGSEFTLRFPAAEPRNPWPTPQHTREQEDRPSRP